MKFRSNRLTQTGDTIVEVLVVIVVFSAVIVGAFSVATKSVQGVRTSEERSEMLAILEGQVELVRLQALGAEDTTDPLYDTSPEYFCLDPSSHVRQNSVGLTNLDDYAQYNASCKNLGTAQLYNVAVTYDPSTHIFTFNGLWNAVGGGKNNVKLVYRILPGSTQAIAASPPAATCSTYGSNLLPNGNFSGSAGNGPGTGSASFISGIPNRGPNVHPDDVGASGLAGWFGGFSIINGDHVFTDHTANPLYAYYFRGDPAASIPASTTFFYSNPNQALSEPKGTSHAYNDTYKGMIWQSSISGLTVGATYEFRAYFDNLLDPAAAASADPLISFKSNDGSGTTTPLGSTTIPKTSRADWTTSWQSALHYQFTASSTSYTFSINDDSGQIDGDDFAMTALSLRQCTP